MSNLAHLEWQGEWHDFKANPPPNDEGLQIDILVAPSVQGMRPYRVNRASLHGGRWSIYNISRDEVMYVLTPLYWTPSPKFQGEYV